MSRTIKPFDAGGWFPIHNAVFDMIMPRLSPNGWKILCVAIRQTWGWVAQRDGDPKVRKQRDRISYSQYRKKAGIGSDSTVRRALKECLDAQYLIRHEVGRQPGTGKPLYEYALNLNYELKIEDDDSTTEPVIGGPPTTDPGVASVTTTDSVVEPATETVVAGPSTTETVVEPATETRAATTTETVETKQINKEQTNNDVVDGQFENIYKLLVDFGVSKATAKELSQISTLENARGWVAYARGQDANLRNPPGLVISKLVVGETAPILPGYSDYVQLGGDDSAAEEEIGIWPELIPDASVGDKIGRVSADVVWQAALGELQLQMTQATFDAWLRDARLLKFQDRTLFVGVETRNAKDWLEHRLLAIIERTLHRQTGGEIDQIRFVARGVA